jgi:hypothetical protein
MWIIELSMFPYETTKHKIKNYIFVETIGYDPIPLVFQTNASTKLASSPCLIVLATKSLCTILHCAKYLKPNNPLAEIE